MTHLLLNICYFAILVKEDLQHYFQVKSWEKNMVLFLLLLISKVMNINIFLFHLI